MNNNTIIKNDTVVQTLITINLGNISKRELNNFLEELEDLKQKYIITKDGIIYAK